MDIFLKLLAVPAMVGLSSLISQRFGQGLAGILSGLPVIAATVTAVLMSETSRQQVIKVAEATYLSAPAAFAYTVAFAWVAHWIGLPRKASSQSSIDPQQALHDSRSTDTPSDKKSANAWWLCLFVAGLVFLGSSLLLLAFNTNPFSGAILALLSPVLALRVMPKPISKHPIKFQIPKSELWIRMLIAFLMALVLLWSAGRVNPAWSGIILTWPVTGCVLPCFTFALYGTQASIQLLRGFANGLLGFTTFFVALALLLKTDWSNLSSFTISAISAAGAAWLLMAIRQGLSRVERL